MPDPIEIKKPRGRRKKSQSPLPQTETDTPPAPIVLRPISGSELVFNKDPLVHATQRQALNPPPKLTLSKFVEMSGKRPKKEQVAADPISRAKDLLQHVRSGTELSGIRDKLATFVTSHRESAEILQILLAAEDQDMLVNLRSDIRRLTNFLRSIADRDDLTVCEGIALSNYLKTLETTANSRLNKLLEEQPKNSMDTLDRLCHAPAKAVSKQFKNIAPHSREILRKLQFKVQRIVTETMTATEETTIKG